MDTLKAGKPTIDLIKLCYIANRPLLLVGTHGIGKSELLQQAARELGIGCIVRDLSIMEPSDLSGLPKVQGQRTVYLPPSFLPTCGKGLLIIEELNRAERYVRAPTLQLLTSRTLNDYVLPPGWLPVGAVNPSGDGGAGGYQVDDLDPALLSRFTQAELRPDRTEWLGWAHRNCIYPSVIAYVESDSTVFDAPESSPRSFAYLSDLMKAAEKLGSASPALVRAAVLGTVGIARGKAFLATLKKVDRPLATDEVLGNYKAVGEKVRRWISEGRMDLVQATLRDLYLRIQPNPDYEAIRANTAQWLNLTRFFADLPGDLRQEAKGVFAGRGYEFPPLRLPRKAPPRCF